MEIYYGIAFIILWVINWICSVMYIFSYTPNWSESEMTEIISNFVKNAPPEKITQTQNIMKSNHLFLVSGLIFLILSLVP